MVKPTIVLTANPARLVLMIMLSRVVRIMPPVIDAKTPVTTQQNTNSKAVTVAI